MEGVQGDKKGWGGGGPQLEMIFQSTSAPLLGSCIWPRNRTCICSNGDRHVESQNILHNLLQSASDFLLNKKGISSKNDALVETVYTVSVQYRSQLQFSAAFLKAMLWRQKLQV